MRTGLTGPSLCPRLQSAAGGVAGGGGSWPLTQGTRAANQSLSGCTSAAWQPPAGRACSRPAGEVAGLGLGQLGGEAVDQRWRFVDGEGAARQLGPARVWAALNAGSANSRRPEAPLQRVGAVAARPLARLAGARAVSSRAS